MVVILWLTRQVKQEFHNSGFMTDVDLDPGCTLNKKIRNAQLAQYNFILGQFQHTLLLFCQLFSLAWLSLSRCPSRYWFLLSPLLVSLHVKVVGEKEKTSNTVNVRTRDNKVHGERTVEECIERLKQLKSTRSRNAEEDFWTFWNTLLSFLNSTSSLVALKGLMIE